MNDTIFDKIIRKEIPSYIVWEDDKHLAFLTPFPNTPGFTVVIPKTNPGDYLFSVDDTVYTEMMAATKTVTKLLEKALGVVRVALIFEGTGVPYLHAKLVPLHGELASQTDVWSKHTEFHEEYPGHITSVEGPKEIQAKIIAEAN
jgi:diadenosine tetraphosphate (Ap4A) HIT family hydrolase